MLLFAVLMLPVCAWAKPKHVRVGEPAPTPQAPGTTQLDREEEEHEHGRPWHWLASRATRNDQAAQAPPTSASATDASSAHSCVSVNASDFDAPQHGITVCPLEGTARRGTGVSGRRPVPMAAAGPEWSSLDSLSASSSGRRPLSPGFISYLMKWSPAVREWNEDSRGARSSSTSRVACNQAMTATI